MTPAATDGELKSERSVGASQSQRASLDVAGTPLLDACELIQCYSGTRLARAELSARTLLAESPCTASTARPGIGSI